MEIMVKISNHIWKKIQSYLSTIFYSWFQFIIKLRIRQFYKCYYESLYTDIILKQNKFTTLSQFLVKSNSFFCFFNNKNIAAHSARSRFPIKLIFCVASDQQKAFVVYLNLLQLAYNFIWNRDNLANNQLCNHFLDQLQFFECYHMLLYHLLVFY